MFLRSSFVKADIQLDASHNAGERHPSAVSPERLIKARRNPTRMARRGPSPLREEITQEGGSGSKPGLYKEIRGPVHPAATASSQRHVSGKLKIQKIKASDRITKHKADKKAYKPTLPAIREKESSRRSSVRIHNKAEDEPSQRASARIRNKAEGLDKGVGQEE